VLGLRGARLKVDVFDATNPPKMDGRNVLLVLMRSNLATSEPIKTASRLGYAPHAACALQQKANGAMIVNLPIG
jgi:hypothetical protein